MAKQMKRRVKKAVQTPDKCYFCTEKKEPVYSDTSVLQRFISDRGKMFAAHAVVFVQNINAVYQPPSNMPGTSRYSHI